MSGRKNRAQMDLFITGSLEQLIPEDHILARVNLHTARSQNRVIQQPLEGRAFLLGKTDAEAERFVRRLMRWGADVKTQTPPTSSLAGLRPYLTDIPSLPGRK